MDIKSFLLKLNKKFSELDTYKKVIVVTFPFITAFLFLIILLVFFQLDAFFIPASIEGTILSSSEKPIENALICVQGKCVNSDRDGKFIIGKLSSGNHFIEIFANGYKTKKEQISLRYSRKYQNFKLEPLNFADISGRLVVLSDQKNFDKVFIKILDYSAKIQENGFFEFQNIPFQKTNIKIESDFFIDQEFEIDINDEQINLGEIQLHDAADIQCVIVNWLNSALIQNAKVTIDSKDYFSNENGIVFFKDIDLTKSKEKNIEIEVDNYLKNTLNKTLVPGKNDLGKIEMIQVGKTVYVSNRLGNKNVYISNLDGSNEKLLTDNIGDSFNPVLSQDKKLVFFLSTREKIKTSNGILVPLLYSVSSEGGKINRISKTNYEDASGIGYFNLVSKKRAFIRYEYQNSKLFIGDIDGTSSKLIFESNGSITSIKISNDGKFVVFSLLYSNTEDHKNGIYKSDIQGNTELIYEIKSDEFVTIEDLSEDQKLMLVQKSKNDYSESDLFIYGLNEKIIEKITNSTSIEMNPQFSNNSKGVIYISQRDNKTDVYNYLLDKSNEIKLTTTGKVSSYFLNQNFVFFVSENVLYITEQSPSSFSSIKKVTESILDQYYNDQYYPYY